MSQSLSAMSSSTNLAVLLKKVLTHFTLTEALPFSSCIPSVSWPVLF